MERDVARCTWHLLTGTQRSRRLQHENKHRKKVASLLKKKQRRLANLINLTLSQQADLRYYQGYHDVACIFLHALGNDGGEQDPLGVELPARVLGQVSQFQLRDSCRASFASLQQCLQWTLFPLLAKLDPVLHNHLQDCDMEPFFCLSWILTWFAHDVRDTNLVKRLFDAFLVSHPLLVLYVSIAMMTHPINRRIILETDCDFAALHHTLSMLPRNSSRMGWKRGRQGGYVSDDDNGEDDHEINGKEEEDGDSQTMQTGTTGNWDQSVASSEHPRDNKSTSLATSTTATGMTLTPSSSVNQMPNDSSFEVGDKQGTSQQKELVPFQLLIDTALGFMKHYPPNSLMELARWYFQHQHMINDVSPTASNIRMLQPPPSWVKASTATADWVYKQRVRQEMGLTKTSRKDRRRKRKLAMQEEEQALLTISRTNQHHLSDDEFLTLHQRTMAVIAAGYGPFGAKEEALYLRRKRMMLRGALLVGVTAAMMGVAYHYNNDSDSLTGNTRLKDAMPQIKTLADKAGNATADMNINAEPVLEQMLPRNGSEGRLAQQKVTQDFDGPQSKALSVTKFRPTSSSKPSIEKSRPVLPPSVSPAKLFPSPGSMRPAATTQSEPSKKRRLFPLKLNQQLKKLTLALYRYFYYWTSKLILRPIQFVKTFLQQLPPSQQASSNNQQ